MARTALRHLLPIRPVQCTGDPPNMRHVRCAVVATRKGLEPLGDWLHNIRQFRLVEQVECLKTATAGLKHEVWRERQAFGPARGILIIEIGYDPEASDNVLLMPFSPHRQIRPEHRKRHVNIAMRLLHELSELGQHSFRIAYRSLNYFGWQWVPRLSGPCVNLIGILAKAGDDNLPRLSERLRQHVDELDVPSIHSDTISAAPCGSAVVVPAGAPATPPASSETKVRSPHSLAVWSRNQFSRFDWDSGRRTPNKARRPVRTSWTQQLSRRARFSGSLHHVRVVLNILWWAHVIIPQMLHR